MRPYTPLDSTYSSLQRTLKLTATAPPPRKPVSMGCGKSKPTSDPQLLAVAPGGRALDAGLGAGAAFGTSDSISRAASIDVQGGVSKASDAAAILEVGALVGTALLDIGRSCCMPTRA